MPRLLLPSLRPTPTATTSSKLQIAYFTHHSCSMASSAGVKRGADHLAGSAADTKKPKANGSITAFFGAPKPSGNLNATGDSAGSASTGPMSKFNKEKWVSNLNAEQKELLKLEIDTLHETWLAHLKDELLTKEFLALKRFLKKEIDSGQKIFPPLEDVYSWYAAVSDPSGDGPLFWPAFGLG